MIQQNYFQICIKLLDNSAKSFFSFSYVISDTENSLFYQQVYFSL